LCFAFGREDYLINCALVLFWVINIITSFFVVGLWLGLEMVNSPTGNENIIRDNWIQGFGSYNPWISRLINSLKTPSQSLPHLIYLHFKICF
jgi:hypothetical protein